MKRLLVCVALLIASSIRADEALVVNTPVTRDAIVSWAVGALYLERAVAPEFEALIRITVVAKRADGQCAMTESGCLTRTITYTGATALTMLNVLNTANLTSNSLVRRVLDRLRTDGYLGDGAFAGSPGIPTFTAAPTSVPTETPLVEPTPSP